MKMASVSETKNRLSALLDRVKHGETIVITDRNRPVAQLSPITPGAESFSDEARLAALERAGVIRRRVVKRKTGPDPLLLKPGPRARGHTSALEALLQEREENR